MTDIASLALEVKFDQVEKSTVALKEQTKAASASERAAKQWGQSQSAAGRASEEFSKRVRRTIQDLEFQRQQLARTSSEQARFAALKRAGVSAHSAEGQAISASVRALQAQQAAYDRTAARGEVFRKVKLGLAIAVTAVTAALVAGAKEAFNYAAGLGEAAEQIGVTARTLQALTFGAVQNGIKVEQLETGLTKFSQKMGEAAEGSKPMIEALNALGVKNLDVQGRLRPTQDLLVDVAKAISEIDDPARRTAAAVEFFGKAGAKLLPLLAQIAQGTEDMAARAQEAGAIISNETSAKLDDFADRLDRAKIIARAWGAETLAATIDASRAFAAFDDQVTSDVAGTFQNLIDNIDQWLEPIGDKVGQEGARAAAMFVAAFEELPGAMGRAFGNAWEAARVATAKGLNALTGWLAKNAPAWMGITATNMDENATGSGAALGGVGERIRAAGQAAAEDMARRQQAVRAARADDAAAVDFADAPLGSAARRNLTPTSTTGARTSAVKDAGKEAENAEKKYAALVLQLEQAAIAQDNMTAASARGEMASEALKVKIEAQEKALSIYGKVLDENDPKLRKLEELMTRIAQGKASEQFNVATIELQRQNVILEAQIRLMNEAPEIQAREIALIKVKQEAEKAGTAITQEQIDKRLQVVEVNERLKLQQEELRRAQDLWTAPLKRALEDIQSTAADAFAEMLESGKVNFEELGNVFKKTITRMAAEFLALATVRPVMNVLVNAIAPGMAPQMGLGGGVPGMGSMNTGGGMLGGMFGGSGIGNWLASPISGSTNLPYGQYGPPAPGQQFGGWAESLTWGQGIGAAAGAGMGIFQLMKGGTGNTIGGLASMVGAGVSLIPGIGQIAGPIIGILGSILPGLFESKPEPPTMRATGAINFTGGQFQASGSEYGGAASLVNALKGVGTGIKSALDLARVTAKESPFGLMQQSFSKGDFSNQTVFITGPGGFQKQWGQSSDPAMQKQAIDTAAANIAHSIMLQAGSGVSDIMREGLSNFGLQNLQHAFSMEELQNAVNKLNLLSDAIASFGKTTTEAGAAFAEIDSAFKELTDIAKEFGISASEASKIEAERQKQRLKVATDFADSITQQILQIQDPAAAAYAQLAQEQKTLLANNDAIVKEMGAAHDKTLEIQKLFALKRQQIAEEEERAKTAAAIRANQAVIDNATASVMRVQDLIRMLTPGGALANVDPRTQLAGLRASANASYAQAIADPTNTALVDRAISDAQAFAETSFRFNAGNAAYERDRAMTLSRAQALQMATGQQAMTQAADPEVKDLLRRLVNEAGGDPSSPDRNAKLDAVLNLLIRYFADEAA